MYSNTLYSNTSRLSEEIRELSEVVRRQKRKIGRYSIYQKFMERVLDHSDEVSGGGGGGGGVWVMLGLGVLHPKCSHVSTTVRRTILVEDFHVTSKPNDDGGCSCLIPDPHRP